MSKSAMSAPHTRVQKVCVLWTHDDNFSRDDVVFNNEKFSEIASTPDSLIQIVALKNATAVKDFQAIAKLETGSRDAPTESHSRRGRRNSVMITLDESGAPVQGGREVDPDKSYIFVAKPMPADLKSKHPQLQVSVSERIAKVFGFRTRTQVVVTSADEEKHSASHVEIAFRDEYLARADMWRMSIAELSNRTVYRGQKLLFMGTIKATVKNVYINGETKHSGYFSSITKPVFRSESARYVLFIQMSKEMWDFDAEGAGEIMFNKVVNGFLPDLFKRWLKISARHLVTIILFTRMQYDGEDVADHPNETSTNGNFTNQSQDFRDYYRVVVSDMASGDWITILYQLKKEFRGFLRDVSLIPKPSNATSDVDEKAAPKDDAELVIAGKPSRATHGNILEAINLAAAQFAKDYIDRDLVRTGISVIVISAGTGVYEVDYNMLKLTTDTLAGSGIGIDLVCLSPMPLHSVPLFKYRNPRIVSGKKVKISGRQARRNSLHVYDEHDDRTPRQHANFGSVIRISPKEVPPILPTEPQVNALEEQDEWRYAMPHWVDISFWSGPSNESIELFKSRNLSKRKSKSAKKGSTFALRCRLYELQMMGVMENELGDISIPYMEEEILYPHRLRQHLEMSENREETNNSKQSDSTRTAYSQVQPDKDTAVLENFHKSWMDAYDQNIFTPVVEREHETSNIQDVAGEGHQELLSKETTFPSSFRSVGPSFGKTARPPPEENFHELIRKRSKDLEGHSPRSSTYRPPDISHQGLPRADILYRRANLMKPKDPRRPGFHQRGNSGGSNGHGRSLQSTPNDSPAPSRGNTPPKNGGVHMSTYGMVPPSKEEQTRRSAGWFLRQISFGGRIGSSTKDLAGAATIEISRKEVQPAKITVENNQKGAIAEKLASTKIMRSQPINIRSASRVDAAGGSPASDRAGQSVETVRGPKVPKSAITSHPNSVGKDPGSTFLMASSRAMTDSIALKLDLSSSGGAKEIPRTLSPTSALAPWAVLVNPCNPKKNNFNVASQFRRWQHIFPKRLRTSSVKWKSLCSPAAVPLTNEYFPSEEQLKTEYNESPYKITQNDDDELLEAPKSRESLIRELIAFRLSHGFQIIVGSAVADFSGTRAQELANIFHARYMSEDGDTVFMCVGNTIHQLVCVAGGEVEIKRFSRKPTTALVSSAGIDTPFPYKPFIRTALEHGYHARDVILHPPRKEYNWNFIDTFLAGYHDEFTEILRFWRARFVLIPVELAAIHRRALPTTAELSEEEIRLEGIRKLTQVWQKFRFVPSEERHFQATTKKQKDPNPLAIEYHTRDPSVIVAAGPDNPLLTDMESEFSTSLFSETDQYHTSNIDIKKLAEDLQGAKGIPMIDRRWHWRLHQDCFTGSDLTSWLQYNFKNIATRDEAVEVGEQLKEKGLFWHVQKRHQFRDGNFFYQIADAYKAPRPKSQSGWFNIRKTDRSVPSTPLSEGPRSSPLTGRSIRSRPSTSDSSTKGDEKDGEKTPTRAGTPRSKVKLSRVMRYDVDPRKRSYRPEIISLHYDRLHNPDNCYHIRIDWMNVTAKLIEDAIVTWATSIEKYGLKLVEVPIAEACNIIDHHPFRSPYIVKLAVQPPPTQPEHVWDTGHFSPQPRSSDRFAYHKALLRKLNFVLDMEAASSFPPDIDVEYSWGSPDYKCTQFIHRSGTLLAQITDEGHFLLLANRLAHNRAKDNTKFRFADPYEHKRSGMPTPGGPVTDRITRSPLSSPYTRPVQDSSLLHSALNNPSPQPLHPLTPEQIKDEIELFCADAAALTAFYKDAFRHAPSPSPRPRASAANNVPDSLIPSLAMPPAISVREASPAGGGGWGGLGASLIGTPGVGGVAGRRAGSEGSGSSVGGARRQDSQGSAGG